MRWLRRLGAVHRTRREHLAHVLGVVRLLVRLEDGAARERLAAQAAAKGPLARVHSAVVFHVVAQLERLAAKGTLEGAVAGVGRQVRHQRADVRERLAAELADDGRALGGVNGRRARHRRRKVHLEGAEVGVEAKRRRRRGGAGRRTVRLELRPEVVVAEVERLDGRRRRQEETGVAVLERVKTVRQYVPG